MKLISLGHSIWTHTTSSAKALIFCFSNRPSSLPLDANCDQRDLFQIGPGRSIDDLAEPVKVRPVARAVEGALLGIPLQSPIFRQALGFCTRFHCHQSPSRIFDSGFF